MTSPTKGMGILPGEWDWMKNTGYGMPMPTSSANVFSTLGNILNPQGGTSVAPTGVPVPGAQQPTFAALMNSLPQSGWANPNAQAWTQQALSQPFMQGWGAPAGTTGGSAAPTPAPTTGAPTNPAQLDAMLNAINKNQKQQQTGVYAGFLSGLAQGGPVGAFTNLALSALTANKDGWLGTGIDGGWAKKTLAQNGYKFQVVGKGASMLIGPDGKKVYGSGAAIKALMDILNSQGITPKMT